MVLIFSFILLEDSFIQPFGMTFAFLMPGCLVSDVIPGQECEFVSREVPVPLASHCAISHGPRDPDAHALILGYARETMYPLE